MIPNDIIQKDYTFEMSFTGTIFNYRKIIEKLKLGDYDLEGIETTWSIFHPFRITIIAIVKVTNKINIEEIRLNRSKDFLEKIERKHNDI